MPEHYCYLLTDEAACTKSYVGYTATPAKRERQHRGEISGGAKSTRRFKGKCRMGVVIGRFRDARAALQFEWAWKHRFNRRAGCTQRLQQLVNLLAEEQWTSKARPARKHAPMKIYWSQLLREKHGDLVAKIKKRITRSSLVQIEHVDSLVNVS